MSDPEPFKHDSLGRVVGDPLRIAVAQAIGPAGSWGSPRNLAKVDRVLALPPIAAASAMLEALEKAEAYIVRRGLRGEASGDAALVAIRAAIAKARGEQS